MSKITESYENQILLLFGTTIASFVISYTIPEVNFFVLKCVKTIQQKLHAFPNRYQDAQSIFMYEIILHNRLKTNDFIIPITDLLLKELKISENERKQLTLVLDLDETLVHSCTESKEFYERDFIVRDEEHSTDYISYKRPHLNLFLHTMSHFYEINCFTASYCCYSDPILDLIDPFKLISKRFYNTSLSTTVYNGYEKDLSVIASNDFVQKLIMVDNSSTACISHKNNLYLINSFRADNAGDDDLLMLIPVLLGLCGKDLVGDVRNVLSRTKVKCE